MIVGNMEQGCVYGKGMIQWMKEEVGGGKKNRRVENS